MQLFEITNGWMGEGYVRLYAWAESEAQAVEMAQAKLKAEAERKTPPYKPSYYEALQVTLLLDSASPAFVTEPSDEGWETKDRVI